MSSQIIYAFAHWQTHFPLQCGVQMEIFNRLSKMRYCFPHNNKFFFRQFTIASISADVNENDCCCWFATKLPEHYFNVFRHSCCDKFACLTRNAPHHLRHRWCHRSAIRMHLCNWNDKYAHSILTESMMQSNLISMQCFHAAPHHLNKYYVC